MEMTRRTYCTFALAALALLGCGRRNGKSGQGFYGDLVQKAVPQVEQAVGVKFKTQPKFSVLSREEVRSYLLRELDQEKPAAELAGQEAAYKAFGMIPDSMDLRTFLVNLLTEQIVGYYDPTTKLLYVVRDAPEDMASVTVTHELVHALQDQYINLDSLQNATGDNDRQMAAQAVIEGEATYEQMSIMTGGRDLSTVLPGGWEGVRDLIKQSQKSQPVFASAPEIIQEDMLFPYLSGAEFIRRFKQHNPGKLPLSDMPVSTAQILHDEAFFGKDRQMPVRVVLPATHDSTLYENDLGEFETRLFLYQHTRNVQLATDAAAGWAGDRYRILRSPKGTSVVWVSVWESTVDAAQMVEALTEAVEDWDHTPQPATTYTGQRTFHGTRRTVLVAPFKIGGRDAVLYVDVPAGTSTALVSPAAVRLK